MTNYHPNPASVLATLIHNGLATEPPDALPPEWRPAYQAALACSERSGMYERRLAFRQAVADDPAGLTMEAAVKEAAKDFPLPGQARLFTAWETQYSSPPVSETVVEGVFERSSLNLIVGAPGSKKTWAAIDLAVAVASGQDWLGHRTSQSPEPVPSEPRERRRGSQPWLGHATGTVAHRQVLFSKTAPFATEDAGASLPNMHSLGENSHQSEPLRGERFGGQVDNLQKSPSSIVGGLGEAHAPSGGLGVRDPQGKIVDHSNSSLPPQLSEPTPVLYIDAEGTVKRMWGRLGATMRGHAADPQIPLHFIPPAFMNFTRQSDAEYITKVANALGVKLIIIDALVNVMGGTDENNVLSVQPIFDALRGIATNTGAAVVVIHHTNKEGVFRGSSFLSSSVDHMLLVESQPDDTLIRLQTYKARDLAPVLLTARATFGQQSAANNPLSSSAGEGAGGEALPTFRLVLVDSRFQSKLGRTSAAVVDHLAELKIASPAQLLESVPHLRPSSFRSVIHDLITLGLVFRTDGGGRGSPARYSLTTDGQIYVSN